MSVDKTHGSPYDRGSADAYYRRSRDPHYYDHQAIRHTELDDEQQSDYELGYSEQISSGNFKDYNPWVGDETEEEQD